MYGFVRFAARDIERWLSRERRKPLMVRGARQVGKSWLVRSVAHEQGHRLLEVNLEQHPELDRVFASLDVDRILLELEAVCGTPPRSPGALLFLDEIQATPHAIPALRYLYEQAPEVPVIAAGSLVETVLRSHDFSMPVGRVEYLFLGPVTFTEFLRAVGEDHLAGTIETWQVGAPLAEAAHRKLLERQRQYTFIGGMPDAVAAYARTGALTDVVDVHRSIIATYKDDFAKYGRSGSALARLQTVFGYVPGALGQKVKYTHISRDRPARDLRDAIDLLALARVVHRVHHSDASGIPLEATLNPHVYKCLFLDVGLAAHVCGIDWRTLTRWHERAFVNEGGLAEQFIGQHLLFRRGFRDEPSLGYWIREGKRNNAEVDYVISRGRRIVPVEVKAGAAGSLKSVHRFLARELRGVELPHVALRFDLNPPSLADYEHTLSDGSGRSVRYRALSLPLYMVEQALRLLDAADEGASATAKPSTGDPPTSA